MFSTSPERPMQVHEALDQIDAIWKQVARTEHFRGYRPATVAATGILGVLTAIAQPLVVPLPLRDPDGYLCLWVSVALACVVLVGVELLSSYLRTESALARQLLRQAVQQFVPCLAGGLAITWAIADRLPEALILLPGLWAICFGLGVFASRPFVTPAAVWIAVYYLLAGGVCLSCCGSEWALHPILMGGTFGVGQLLTAGVLLKAEESRDVSA